MKYSIRELKAKISSKLLSEEFEVTNHNISIGRFIPKVSPMIQNRFKVDSVNPGASGERVQKSVSPELEIVGLETHPLKERAKDKGFALCEHGASKITCKKCMFK